MDIHNIINSIYPIPEASKEILAARLSEVAYPKGHHLMEAGKIGTDIYFIRKGIVRAYAPINGDQVTFWFGCEGSTILSMKSYACNQPGYETIELMEDCILYVLKRDDLYKLFDKDIHIANWGRKFAETELIKAEEKIISLLFCDASDHYKELLNKMPDLLQRIPLGVIASYLGVTQVSLSRIRAKLK